MTDFYKILQTLPKTKPHFLPSLLLMKYQDFQVNIFLAKQHVTPQKAVTFCDYSPAGSARPSVNNKLKYLPQYQ